MNIEAVNMANIQQQASQKPSDDVATQRKAKENDGGVVETTDTNKVQPEELLSQIKGLTEDGNYSVRFENDDASNQLIVKIVDIENDEVIRQMPAEEVLNMTARLEELRGNIVNTKG
ncbi:MAG: flagellar protein FlaG [Deltaproteobacteria bacterium]|nr:flagellar protein FlaG [Deltaproteobacteria bacterium]